MMQGVGRRRPGHPSPAMVVAMIALSVALGGTAVAAIGGGAPNTAERKHKKKKRNKKRKLRLGKNSVGTRQLKGKAVTTGKLANNAVNGKKVAAKSLTGQDINLNALGTVPEASHAGSAGNADTPGGHSASCPSGTTLLRGYCFDSSPNGELPTLQDAADACADKGGWLPSVMQLYSVRKIINLGTGVGTDHQYTDNYAADPTGASYTSVVINGTGAISKIAPNEPSRYICMYPLVR
jgi:hypothetical protein